jgi:thiol-disulfide isomerase/thioredoxin
VVDQWSYYRNGLEVYRDIDVNSNGKADQYRWFHMGGTRWGMDTDEDGMIDAWKVISPEEVSAEIIAALAERDADRFMRVVLTPAELRSLGLGAERTEQVAEVLEGLEEKFTKLAAEQTVVGPTTKWLQFGGNRPGLVPAGRDGSSEDLVVYENVLVLVATDGEHRQVQIGTLVQVGNTWRVIGLPQPISENQAELADSGLFFGTSAPPQTAVAGTPDAAASTEMQKLLGELRQLDADAEGATTPQQQAAYNARRADLLERIAAAAGSREDRQLWLTQLADTVSAAIQSGVYPDGADRLGQLLRKLRTDPEDKDLAAYVMFRLMTAQYALSLQAPDAKFEDVQADWLESLQQYVKAYPASPTTPEAMLQLAMAYEFGGQEEEAKSWYTSLAERFPSSEVADKAEGAKRRLESVGKMIAVQGSSPTGGTVDLRQFRGKVVLIQYWATWCEPCKADMAALKELLTKYGSGGFQVIGVSLDSRREDLAGFLSNNRVPWPLIYEEGGLDSRPANEMGILTLPTMILVDEQGRVVNRNVHVAELDRELQRLMR